jgi:hypothetical protein
MSDIEIKLEPQDEFNHQPDEASNYNESMYFNVFDHNKKMGGWFRLGNRPNEGYAEMTCCIYLPDGRIGFMFGRPEITTNEVFDAGGMKFEVIDPFKELKVHYKGKLLLLDNPKDMLNPSKAFKENSRVECEANINISGISPMFGGQAVRKDGKPLERDPEKSFSKAHYEQHTSGKGTIKINGEEWTIDGLGLRDKSWGPRYWQAIEWYRWLTININDEIGFMFSIVHQSEDSERRGGIVLKDGKYEIIQDCRIDTQYDEDHFQKTFTAWAKTDEDEYEVTGKVLSLIPLRNRRNTPEGDSLVTRITEGMTEYTYKGIVGYGMSEYLDQVIDGKPIGP